MSQSERQEDRLLYLTTETKRGILSPNSHSSIRSMKQELRVTTLVKTLETANNNSNNNSSMLASRIDYVAGKNQIQNTTVLMLTRIRLSSQSYYCQSQCPGDIVEGENIFTHKSCDTAAHVDLIPLEDTHSRFTLDLASSGRSSVGHSVESFTTTSHVVC